MARSKPKTQSTAAGAAAQEASQDAERDAPASGSASLPATTDQEYRSLATPPERNAFESYGDQVSTKFLVGTLLKFNKGDWLTGDNDSEVEVGTRFVANMNQLMIGWIKWVDNRPDQQIMGALADNFQAPRRNTLGDEDEDEWELDTQGRPRDPWQFSNYLVLKEPGEDASEENLYTFATSSKGGIGAIGELCKKYGKEMRIRPDEYPIVEIGVHKYKHSNPEFGIIKTPTFTIVGWEKKSLFDPVAGSDDEGEDDAPEQAAPPAKKKAAARKSR